jgi:hypothetical protein
MAKMVMFQCFGFIKTVPFQCTFITLNGALNILANFLFLFRKLCSIINIQSASVNITGLTFELKYSGNSSIALSVFLIAIFLLDFARYVVFETFRCPSLHHTVFSNLDLGFQLFLVLAQM